MVCLCAVISTTPVEPSCTPDDRAYWKLDPAFVNGVEGMFFGGIFIKPRILRFERDVLISRILDIPLVPFSPGCAGCLVDAYVCYRSVESQFETPHPFLWPFGITQTIIHQDALIIQIERTCVPSLIRCSGATGRFALPGIWPRVIYDRLEYAKRIGDNEYIQAHRARCPADFDYTLTLDNLAMICGSRMHLMSFANRARCWGDFRFWFVAARLWDVSDFVETYAEETGVEHPPIDSRDAHGNTAIHIAIMSRSDTDSENVVKWLVSRGGDINLKGEQGNTALMMAVLHGHSLVVAYLLSQGVDVNVVNDDGMTALMFSALGSLEIVKMIVDHGANIDVEIVGGWTALKFATANDAEVVSRETGLWGAVHENVEYLLSKGASHYLSGTRNSRGLPEDTLNRLLGFLPSSESFGVYRDNIGMRARSGDIGYIKVAKFRHHHANNDLSGVCPEWPTFSQEDNTLFDAYSRCHGTVDRLACLLASHFVDDSRIGCLACFHQFASCPNRMANRLTSRRADQLRSDGTMLKYVVKSCLPILSTCTGVVGSAPPKGWVVHQSGEWWNKT